MEGPDATGFVDNGHSRAMVNNYNPSTREERGMP